MGCLGRLSDCKEPTILLNPRTSNLENQMKVTYVVIRLELSGEPNEEEIDAILSDCEFRVRGKGRVENFEVVENQFPYHQGQR